MNKKANGYIVLITMLVTGAIGLSVTISLLLLGISHSRTTFALEQSYQAKALADACIEEALQEIHDSTPYAGSDTLSFTYGDCTYTVVSTGGVNRTITSTGIVDTIEKKVKVSISAINPLIILDSWQEVADF